MIGVAALGIAALLDGIICLKKIFYKNGNGEWNLSVFQRLCFALGIVVYMGIQIWLKREAYFNKTAWLAEAVCFGVCIWNFAGSKRLIQTLWALFFMNMQILADYALSYALIHYNNRIFTTAFLLHENSIERNAAFCIIRIVVILIIYTTDFEIEIVDVRKNRYLLVMLDILSLLFLLYLNREFVLGHEEIRANYFYIALGIFIFCGIWIVLYNLINVTKEQMRFMEQRNKEMIHNYDRIYSEQKKLEQAAHDFKNHVRLLNKYLEEGEYERAREYGRKLGEPLKLFTQKSWSGNTMLDTILNTKIEEAEQKEIKICLDIKKCPQIPVTDFDLCVMLSNLLDNAIEACENIRKEKYIHIKLGIVNRLFFIRIVNSMERKPKKQGRSYLTTKKDKDSLHGIGLESVRSAVSKYDGTVILNHSEKEFTATISIEIDLI